MGKVEWPVDEVVNSLAPSARFLPTLDNDPATVRYSHDEGARPTEAEILAHWPAYHQQSLLECARAQVIQAIHALPDPMDPSKPFVPPFPDDTPTDQVKIEGDLASLFAYTNIEHMLTLGAHPDHDGLVQRFHEFQTHVQGLRLGYNEIKEKIRAGQITDESQIDVRASEKPIEFDFTRSIYLMAHKAIPYQLGRYSFRNIGKTASTKGFSGFSPGPFIAPYDSRIMRVTISAKVRWAGSFDILVSGSAQACRAKVSPADTLVRFDKPATFEEGEPYTITIQDSRAAPAGVDIDTWLWGEAAR